MLSKFFGQYLMEKGLITRERLLDAIQYQSTIRLPLCALAIAQGHLADDRLARIDEARLHSGTSPMDLAAKEGFLTFEQLEELSRSPVPRAIYLGEALIQKGFLNLSEFNRALRNFRRECPDHYTLPSALPDGTAIPHRDIVESLLSTLIDTFVHYTKQVARLNRISTSPPSSIIAPFVFSQHVKGDIDCCIQLAVEEPLELAIASEMMGETITAVNEVSRDAVVEFLNVVTGITCSKLGEMSIITRATPPEILTAAEVLCRMTTDVAVFDLETMKASFQLLIVFIERK